MIKGLLVVFCGAALMGCAMDAGEDETPDVASSSQTESFTVNLERDFHAPQVGTVPESDRCGSPHKHKHKINVPLDQPADIRVVGGPVTR